MTELIAHVYGATAPDEYQLKRIGTYLEKEYNKKIKLEFHQDKALKNGFRIEIGTVIYDFSVEGRFSQLKAELSKLAYADGDIVPLIRDTIQNFTPHALAVEIGTVISVTGGVARVAGLDNAQYGEILIFDDGIRGMVLNLNETEIGCIIFGDEAKISEGSHVRRTGKAAGMPVGDAFLGRVVDALGNPIDSYGIIKNSGFRLIEQKAPGITQRQSVNSPLETGILTIDSMFPIGKGQRELIIGDRQTGKTSIAVDTILNQKGKDVICIYVAIGQKASFVARLVEGLSKRGAMEYTTVVYAGAGESAPMQYIAPYSGCALGEYFMNKGKDVLIVYDDLSKHAIAYRTISLLLERSPGREAYPGDVFYLHSRLLERSAHLSDELGGGSMTALPIVETQAGDVSAYIPTNIISITDGQIFLESDLFFAGQRPAVNVGLSVSRVGGAAQTKAMKKASGAIRLSLAQYREIEVFTQFSSDLDETTKKQLNYGQSLMQLLRQPRYSPLCRHEQVIILIAALNYTTTGIPPKQLKEYMSLLLKHIEEQCSDICHDIDIEGKLSDEAVAAIVKLSKAFAQSYIEKNIK